jgi:hypothetical protein
MNPLISLFDSFVSFPTWLRNSIYILTALSLAGISFAFTPIIALMVAIGLLLLIVVLGVYAYVLKHRRDARLAAMGGEIEQNSLATPVAISDPARKARLDDLRKRFQEGLDKFKAVGKDLYKLPWYVVIGEPAAGKSEAIRRCDVGFPPGMQDDFQGVGGTINMNWWFTNYAVILDTAGRLLFEEVAPGTTGEWKEFLGLLRKYRPNCPINGLLLVIPADSLIKDSAKRIDERSGWIARQLDNIQRTLDIRFPVYVIISKCDLLNGFREFFEEIQDPDAQRQMLGWSNPEAIDTPFEPAFVDQHLQSVVERLRRRRLKLLEDPVAKESSHRRTDEVDRLYAFPNSLTLIAPSLRRYLSTIFVSNEWSAKPLFLRGIYFTSSLREGSELDQELAQAIGMSVDDLPSGRVWERDIPFFLRDLFIEKIFREWGLVTRATNTKRMLRRRQLILFGFGALALALLLFFSWFGYSSMKESIGSQSGYWLRASEGWTPADEWMPIVERNGDDYVYKGDTPVGSGTGSATRNLFDGGGKTLVEFHTALRKKTESPLHIAWVFRPFNQLMGNLDAERNRAQRIVLEGSVVKPLVAAARDKITAETSHPIPNPALEANSLLGLIQIETGIVKRRAHMGGQIAQPDEVLSPLQTFVSGNDYNPLLAETCNWTYNNGDGAGKWPADWLTGGNTLASDQPGYNRAIDMGIEHFRTSARERLAASEVKWNLIVELVDFLKNQYAPKEDDLFHGAINQGSALQLDPLLQTPYNELGKVSTILDQKLEEAKKAGLFDNCPVSLSAAYELIIKDRQSEQTLCKTMLTKMLTETLSAETQAINPPLIIKEIEDRLNVVLKETQGGLVGLDEAELKNLDEAYLADHGHGVLYTYRLGLYRKSIDAARQDAQFGNLIGSDWAPLRKVIDDVAQARREIVVYQGGFKTECSSLCAYWLDYAERHQIDECCQAYLSQAEGAVEPILHFPIVWPPEDVALTGDQVKEANTLVARIHRDLHSDTFSHIRPDARAPLEAFDKRLAALDPVLRALVAPDGTIASCSIAMPAGPPRAQAVTTDALGNPVSAPAPEIPTYELRLGTPTGGEHGNLGNQGRIPLGEGRSFIDRMPVDMVFHFHRYDDQGKHEVACGVDWCALRLLNKSEETNESENDGLNWDIRIDDHLHPDVVVQFVFEHALPALPKWPTKDIMTGN